MCPKCDSSDLSYITDMTGKTKIVCPKCRWTSEPPKQEEEKKQEKIDAGFWIYRA